MNRLYNLSGKTKVLLAVTILILLSTSTVLYYLKMEHSKQILPLPAYDIHSESDKGGEINAGMVENQKDELIDKDKKNMEPVKQYVVVDVKGAVHNPGVYQLEEGSRVHHAIKKANGLTDESDALKINLAEPLKDGAVVFVPFRKKDVAESSSNTEINSLQVFTEKVQDFQPGVNMQEENNEHTENTPMIVNINTAGVEELQKIKGLGPSKSEAIIAYRQQHGPFKSINDLTSVKGIGVKTLEKWKEYLSTD